ncbi:hypothetical protein ACIOC1_00390 [Streptomyces sp. NPDC088197]|uniref:hypothetical protein n=1 Tax=Streptomyces sp. NPDC088197 TaxID=3365840 RepID=UPI0038219E6E
MTRLRAGTKTDRAGNTVPDWSDGAVTRLVIGDVSVQPTVQDEAADATRTAVVTGWHVLSAPGTSPDVRSSDRVEFGGLMCEVIGEVAAWPDPLDGGTHHVEWSMRRTTG